MIVYGFCFKTVHMSVGNGAFILLNAFPIAAGLLFGMGGGFMFGVVTIFYIVLLGSIVHLDFIAFVPTITVSGIVMLILGSVIGRLRDLSIAVKLELHKRGEVEKALRKSQNELEIRVKERTLELEQIAIELKKEVTERRQAEKELKEKEDIIKSSSSFIAMADLDGGMTYGNPAFMKAWGFDTSEEFLGNSFKQYWTISDQYDEIMKTLQTKGKWYGEMEAICKDGTRFPVQVSAAMVFDSTGNPSGLMSTSTDITERRQAEIDREKLISELKDALATVKMLSGLLPICSFCKKIRDDKGYWNQIENYIRDHSEAEFSHGICEECSKKHYPNLDI